MPRGFSFPNRGPHINNVPADVFVPLSFTAAELGAFGAMFNNSVVGRLKSGVTVEQAAAEADAIAKQIVADFHPLVNRLFAGHHQFAGLSIITHGSIEPRNAIEGISGSAASGLGILSIQDDAKLRAHVRLGEFKASESRPRSRKRMIGNRARKQQHGKHEPGHDHSLHLSHATPNQHSQTNTAKPTQPRMAVLHRSVRRLFIAEGDHGIDMGGAACGPLPRSPLWWLNMTKTLPSCIHCQPPWCGSWLKLGLRRVLGDVEIRRSQE